MSSLSQAYRDYPINPHQIIPLDFKSVKELPDSHIWPELDEDYPFRDLLHGESVPVIDLAGAKTAKLVGRACETWGMLQVTNHGIPLHFLGDVESAARRLFSLPAQQKLKALCLPEGATCYGVARISPFFSKSMWHEGFTIMGSAIDHAHRLWPLDYTHFCDVMEKYQKEIRVLAEQLMELILDSLGMTKEEVTWAGSSLTKKVEGACTASQLNSYPSCPDPNRAMGLAAHTDTSLFTILHQCNTSGLQVFRDGFGWIIVPPVAGALVVNVGDLFHILSNARYPTALHRAVMTQTYHRISVAYFYGPPTNTKVSPFSELVDPDYPPQYRSLTWEEYISIKAKHLDKALSLIHAKLGL